MSDITIFQKYSKYIKKTSNVAGACISCKGRRLKMAASHGRILSARLISPIWSPCKHASWLQQVLAEALNGNVVPHTCSYNRMYPAANRVTCLSCETIRTVSRSVQSVCTHILVVLCVYIRSIGNKK